MPTLLEYRQSQDQEGYCEEFLALNPEYASFLGRIMNNEFTSLGQFATEISSAVESRALTLDAASLLSHIREAAVQKETAALQAA